MSLLDLTTNIKSLISQNDWGDKSLVVGEIKDLINKIETQNFAGSVVSPVVVTNTPIKSDEVSFTQSASEFDEFDYLKNLLESENWPEAVLSFQIADEKSEADKSDRAEGIADVLLPDLQGVKFLDFGCGEGHISRYCAEKSSLSVGYDIVNPTGSLFKWDELDNNLLLTTNFEKVKEQGPYDVILLYDVLDHCKTSNASHHDSIIEVLSQVKSVLSPEGKIYLRFHPWCSRHGGHLYRKLNKAYIHLIFSEQELNSLGLEVDFTHKVLFPLLTYNKAIKSTNLNIISTDIDKQYLESFFSTDPVIKKRLISIFGLKSWGDKGAPEFQTSQCFVDYILSH